MFVLLERGGVLKPQHFGSAHTEKKLQLVAHYLERFTTALKNQPFETLSRLVKTETTPVDLWGKSETRSVKAGGIDEIAELVLERLAGVFKGGVVKYGLPLGTQGRAMYTLVFACANPAPKACQLALRLAGAVLKA